MVRRQERGNTTDGMTQSTSIPLNREMYVEDCIDGSRNLKIGDGIHLPKDLPNVCPSIKATNLIQNGDFSDGTKGWASNGYSTLTSSNNTLKVTRDQYTTVYTSISQIPLSHKVYIRFKIKSPKDSIQVKSIGNEVTTTNLPISPNSFVIASVVQELNHNVNKLGIEVSGANEFELQYFSAIDLTKCFDIGDEPATPQMDWLMSQFPDNWFDGTKTLIDFKVMIKFLINFLKT